MKGTIVHSLMMSAFRFPDKTAINQNDKSISYSELWASVCQGSSFLLEHGLNESERVLLWHENSIEYVIVYYAVLKAGGAVVALNTESKYSDVNNILRHSDARFIFLSEKKYCLDDFSTLMLQIVIFNEGENKQTDNSEVYVWSDILGDDYKEKDDNIYAGENSNACIIYTSGTTGNPKGVSLSQLNLVENVESIVRYLKLTENDSILNVLPFFYSYGNSVLHTHLSVGATIYIHNSLMYPIKVLEKIVLYKVSGFSGVPSTFALLLSRTKLEDYDLTSLRYVTQAGGAMPSVNIKDFLAKVPEIEFYVMYGQTEATARISYLPPERLLEKLGSVGVAIPGVVLEVRDDRGKKLGSDVVGEVYVSGKNIMQGYWENDEATSLVIIDGWLKTGDLGYMDHEGYVYLSGRKTDMIKVGGHRISPLEIEEIISQISNVEEVVVTGVQDDMLGQTVKAVVVLKEKNDKCMREIKAYCSKNLASFKIPKQIDIVDNLPKTSSGKIKRFLL